jgi:hypothetical protein
VNNYENPIKWCTIDLLLRDCWVLKKLISEYYFKQPNTNKSIKFKTVKDFFATVETNILYEEYDGSDSEEEDDQTNLKNLDTFENEYIRMIERSEKMGLISSEESADESKTKKNFLKSNLSVSFFTQFLL